MDNSDEEGDDDDDEQPASKRRPGFRPPSPLGLGLGLDQTDQSSEKANRTDRRSSIDGLVGSRAISASGSHEVTRGPQVPDDVLGRDDMLGQGTGTSNRQVPDDSVVDGSDEDREDKDKEEDEKEEDKDEDKDGGDEDSQVDQCPLQKLFLHVDKLKKRKPQVEEDDDEINNAHDDAHADDDEHLGPGDKHRSKRRATASKSYQWWQGEGQVYNQGQMIGSSSPSSSSSSSSSLFNAPAAAAAVSDVWACASCTLHNTNRYRCEACSSLRPT